jgi:hypothetical protein
MQVCNVSAFRVMCNVMNPVMPSAARPRVEFRCTARMKVAGVGSEEPKTGFYYNGKYTLCSATTYTVYNISKAIVLFDPLAVTLIKLTNSRYPFFIQTASTPNILRHCSQHLVQHV